MSSMSKNLFLASAAAISFYVSFQDAKAEDEQQELVVASSAGADDDYSIPRQQVDPSRGNIPAALQRWRSLSSNGNYSFNEYASFLMTYPGWPQEKDMRRYAEQSLGRGASSQSQVVAYFDRMPPVTNAGRAQYALALNAAGRKQEAADVGRKAWRMGPMNAQDESQLLTMLSRILTRQDHDARIDALLWKGSYSAASGLLSYASPEKQPLFRSRIAVLSKSADASQLIGQTGNAALTDPGLVTDRATMLRRSGATQAARQLLANRPSLAFPPFDAEEWYETLLTNAKGAESDGQYQLAFAIASKIDDGLPSGTNISEEELGVRDDYTSLAWLAGTMAHNRLGRYREAIGMFERYAIAAKSPQTKTKGWYWAGRAAIKAGDNAAATRYFEQAAVHYDCFYGQLSLEALRRPLPTNVARAPIGPVKESSNPVYAAARIAASSGGHKEQTQFLRAIANSAESATEFENAFSLANAIGRPDLAVMAGRNARVEGHSNYVAYGFPTVSVPSSHGYNWTMIHAISRQESQFDRAALSHAGARGLMQLMPGTARETAGKMGLGYSLDALTSDPSYNIQLGSTYFQRMLDYYNGSYPLAVAAYNAGPGNVNKWLRANGDPRSGGMDIISWIERIPIFETRNYVQRVLENAVVYDMLAPDRARMRGANPLSQYLGKRTPG